MIGVYFIRHPTGPFYVGQTKQFGTRRSQHRRKLEQGIHPAEKLQTAFTANPTLEWEFIPTTDVAEAQALEDYHLTIGIDDPNCANKYGNGGVNPRVDGHTGITQSRETVEKRAAKLRGSTMTDQARLNISSGHRESDKVKAHMARLQEAGKRKVVVDGVVYDSVKTTADAYSIHSATVLQRINSNSDRFSSWTYY
jgi:hypothetical protein